MERIIRDQLVEHMIVNNRFAKSQHGFISGKSCATQLLEFFEDVSEAPCRCNLSAFSEGLR